MQEYDRTLKVLFQSSAVRTIRSLTGQTVTHWLNIELPEIQSRQVDLLGETADGELLHLELQSTNDSAMALRMIEYCVAIFRSRGRIPRQLLVYVGRNPLAMPAALSGHGLRFQYEVVDMRKVETQELIDSPHLSDNMIGILGKVVDLPEAIRQVLSRIAERDADERLTYLKALLLISGLRGLESFVEREVRTVPVLIDIMENRVLGREYKRGLDTGVKQGLEKGLEKGLEQGLEKGLEQGLEKGLEQGLEKGLEQGRREGEAALLRRQLETRFGALPQWAARKVSRATLEQIEAWAIGLLTAKTLDSLLRPKARP